MKFQTQYDRWIRPAQSEFGDGMTKQAFKDECDINRVVNRYRQTGVWDHVRSVLPQFQDVTEFDFQRSMNTVIQAEAAFAALPAAVRKRFSNDPAEFLGFVRDPANFDEAVKLGLVDKPATQAPGEVAGDPGVVSPGS